MNYFLGQLVWEDAALPGWIAPPGVEAFLDLRTLTQQGTARTAEGFVLMAANRDPLPGETLIADSERGALKPKARDAVKDLLGLPENLPAGNLQGMIHALLGDYADPDAGKMPLMPGRDGMMRFRLGGLAFNAKCPKSGDHWNAILKVLQAQYRAVKENGQRDMHRQLLTVWQKKYKIADHELFIPADLPKETPIPHETTVRDNFDVGNHADLSGQLSSDGDWSWTKIAGSATALIKTNASAGADITISSGQYCTYRADKDLSSEDMYVQADVLSTNDLLWPGLIARKDGTGTETYYDVSVRMDTDQLRIRKVVAGIGTTLQNNAQAMDLSTLYTVRLVVDGSTLQTFFEGVQVGADLTDTAIATGLRCGMGGEESGVTVKTGIIEDFEGGDWPIVIPPDPPPPYAIAVPYRTLDDARYAIFTADDNMTPDIVGISTLTGEPTCFLGLDSGIAAYPMVSLRHLDGSLHAIAEKFTNSTGAHLWHKSTTDPYTTWEPAPQHEDKAGPLFDAAFSGQCIGATVLRIPPVTGPAYLATFQAAGSGKPMADNIIASLRPLSSLPLPESLTLEEFVQDCAVNALTMLTQELPDGEVGVAYVSTAGGSTVVRLVAIGGQPPYRWAHVVESGNLPDGITFDNSRFTGTPTLDGVFTFTIRVVDALGAMVSREFTITVAP